MEFFKLRFIIWYNDQINTNYCNYSIFIKPFPGFHLAFAFPHCFFIESWKFSSFYFMLWFFNQIISNIVFELKSTICLIIALWSQICDNSDLCIRAETSATLAGVHSSQKNQWISIIEWHWVYIWPKSVRLADQSKLYLLVIGRAFRVFHFHVYESNSFGNQYLSWQKTRFNDSHREYGLLLT